MVTLRQALARLAGMGIEMTRKALQSSEGSRDIDIPDGSGRYIMVYDYRPLGDPYSVDWVFSVMDMSGRETARFNVKRSRREEEEAKASEDAWHDMESKSY